MDSPWTTSCRAFGDAAEWFVATAALADGRWTEPGLGEWDVRSLVGHTSRALLTVETYLVPSGGGRRGRVDRGVLPRDPGSRRRP